MRNGLAQLSRWIRTSIVAGIREPGDAMTPAPEESLALSGGAFDSVSGEFRPAGIVGVTQLSEPFYVVDRG